MDTKTEIIVIGSHAPGILVHVKRIPTAGETVIGWDYQEPKDGGKGTNQAIAAALLGGRVSFVGCFGKDRIGTQAEKWLIEVNVDTSLLRWHDSISTGGGVTLLNEEGVPAMVSFLGANEEVNESDVDNALNSTPNAKVLLTQFEIPINIALYAAKKAKEQGLLSIVTPGPAPEKPVSGLESASILVPNETEAQILLGQEPGDDYIAEDLVHGLKEKFKIPVVIITLGEDGIVGIDDQGIWNEPALDVDAVDTSGAGDVFCAALAVGITGGKTIRESSKWACKVAGISVTKPGTIPAFPTIERINSLIK